MAGVGLVVGHAAMDSASRFAGLVLAFVGVLGLVSGTLYFGRFCRGVPLLPGATAQFLSAAAVSALGAWLLETPHADWTASAIAAVAVEHRHGVAGRDGAVFVMLARGTAARASANFYLVPGTAALLAWLLLGRARCTAGGSAGRVRCWLRISGLRPELLAWSRRS